METGHRNTIVIIAALIVGIVAGYVFGVRSGRRSAEERDQEKINALQSALNIYVPPLPDMVTAIGGKITAISGDSFTLEIPSFTDRYPVPGKPAATETRTIRISADTKLTDTNFNPKTFKSGLPQQRSITASDLAVGDTVSVSVLENARTEQNLTVTEIHRSSGI